MSQGRRVQRRVTAFLLYQRDLTSAELPGLYAGYERDTGEAVGDEVRRRVEEVWEQRVELDRAIDEAAHGWTAERMAVLERNILRLAVWELRAGAVPAAVAIDEAVSLAKRYASPEAGTLVNGILGRIARVQGVGR